METMADSEKLSPCGSAANVGDDGEFAGEVLLEKSRAESTSSASSPDILDELFKGVRLLRIEGTKSEGRMRLLMELIAQNLVGCHADIIYLNVTSKLNILQIEKTCMRLIEEDQRAALMPAVLSRLRVVEIRSSKELHDILNNIEAVIRLFSYTSILVIDELLYYPFDAFVHKSATGHQLSRRKYIKSFDQHFRRILKRCNVSIFYTLSDCLTQEKDYSTDHSEELKMYNRIRHRTRQKPIGIEQMPILEVENDGDSGENLTDDDETGEKGADDEEQKEEVDANAPHRPDVILTIEKFNSTDNDIFLMHVDKDERFVSDLSFRIGESGIEWL